MKIAFFTHSVLSDWNNGHAHFLRGVARELVALGHNVMIYEARSAWSMNHLLRETGPSAVEAFHRCFPELRVCRYAAANLEKLLDGVDAVVVQEWNPPELVARLGRLREQWRTFRLFFHDAHHRAVTAPEEMSRFDLSGYDGALVFGEILRRIYLERSWIGAAWTWHEAADTRLFRPPDPEMDRDLDLVWVGNWGDGERSAELREYLVGPASELRLRATVHGVRYSLRALQELRAAGLTYGGWLPNHRVPELFARAKATIHVPRAPYASALPGIPTIRPFEALACGLPLISAPWQDQENLLNAGTDYLPVQNGREATERLRDVLGDARLRESLARCGLQTIRDRHTCRHRAAQLPEIFGVSDNRVESFRPLAARA